MEQSIIEINFHFCKEIPVSEFGENQFYLVSVIIETLIYKNFNAKYNLFTVRKFLSVNTITQKIQKYYYSKKIKKCFKLSCVEYGFAESKKVVNLPPDKNIAEGKPSSQNNRKWTWLGSVIGASIVFRGPSSGQWPCDRNVFLTLALRRCSEKPAELGLATWSPSIFVISFVIKEQT